MMTQIQQKDVLSFGKYLESMWRERRSNWNSSGDIFSTLTGYFNQSANPYIAFLELVETLPDQAVDSPDTLYNCVWKHFCNWIEQRSRPQSGSYDSRATQNQNGHDPRIRFLTPDVLKRAAHVALKNRMKTFTTACALFRFTDLARQHAEVVEIFAQKVRQLAIQRDYQLVALILDHQIDLLPPSPLLDDDALRKLSLFLICTNEGPIAKKILSKVSPVERVHGVISFLDSIVGAPTQTEQDQIVRRELGQSVVESSNRFSTLSLYTISVKLTKELAIPCRHYPNMTFVQLKGTTKFITSATFGAEAEMDLATFREAIHDLADMDERFPSFVVKYMIQNGNYDEAHYFAEKFKLTDLLQSPALANWTPSEQCLTNGVSNWPMSNPCYELPLKDEEVIFVDSLEKYRAALNHINSLPNENQDHIHRCVGIDTEWTPVHRPDRKQAISILQLALIDRVYIVDIENLSPILSADDWLLLDNFFKHPDVKKLTYAFRSDLTMLKFTFPEAANLDLTRIVSHVDLEKLTHHLWKALRAVDCGPLTLYNNKVVLDATSSAIPTSLTDVAKAFLGQRIPKMYRLSNWSRRPLLRGQLIYAAIDSYCLLEIYREISFVIASQKLKVSADVSMLKKGDVILPNAMSDSPEIPLNQPKDIHILCDALLTDVGAYLQQLGFDVQIVEDQEPPSVLAQRAFAQQRVAITVPHLVGEMQQAIPSLRVIGVPFATLQEQADFVACRLNVQINCDETKPLSPYDPIQRLQQIAGRRREEVYYDIQGDPYRPPHDPMFTATCRLVSNLTNDITVEAQAVATNKKEAKKRVAANMIVKLTACDHANVVSQSLTAPRGAPCQPNSGGSGPRNFHRQNFKNTANNTSRNEFGRDFWYS